ncbi:MAG: type II toxin-antitoxin system VapC family toxin [Rhizobiales bacterium]|nr:type II toxin-antitoxin system VapC family toxin [Hyphomicrobiales bacterium]
MVARAQEEAAVIVAVLDASAVLAVYFDEPGAGEVSAALPGALLSAVNYTEVIGKCLDHGEVLAVVLRKLSAMGFSVVAHDAHLARRAGALLPLTKRLGLSLADRACLALAERERLPALTADRSWKSLALDIDIRLIR